LPELELELVASVVVVRAVVVVSLADRSELDWALAVVGVYIVVAEGSWIGSSDWAVDQVHQDVRSGAHS
jgi:hypothetical protein